MRVLNFLIFSLSLILCLWWANYLHSYFYEYTIADFFSLLLFGGLGLTFAYVTRNARFPKFLPVLIAFFFPLLPYFVISEGIDRSDLSWLILYAFVFIQSFALFRLNDFRTRAAVSFSYALLLVLPVDFNAQQQRYYDKVVSSVSTRHGQVEVVSWKDDFWLYYNDQLQFATIDKHLLQESYVRPAAFLSKPKSVLILGGESGMIAEELSKIRTLERVTTIPIDYEYYEWVKTFSKHSLGKEVSFKVIKTQDLFQSVDRLEESYDLIFLDLPDPVDIGYRQYYSQEFLQLCIRKLNDSGFIVTQAGDAIKNPDFSVTISNVIKYSGLDVLYYENQVPTIGQWSWVVGSTSSATSEMEQQLEDIPDQNTRWWNQEAMKLMLNAGKSKSRQSISSTTLISLVGDE